MKIRRNKFCNKYIISGLLIVLSSLFNSCSFNKEKLNNDIPNVEIKILNLEELKNISVNLGCNTVKIHLKSTGAFIRKSKLIITLKDGYTTGYNVTLGPVEIEGGYLDTVVVYTTKEFVDRPNNSDFGLIKLKIVSGKFEQEFVQSKNDFNGKYKISFGDYRYFQSECEYFDGGIYKYIIRKYYYSTRAPIKDKFGLLQNSGLMVTDSLTSKKMSKDEFLSFLKICRNIQKDQKEKLENNKGTGELKFDRSNIPLFVSHNSIEKVKLDSLLNSVFNEK
jgi:hypothetical protein